jgi:Na+/melibiose symporter-like transporter
LYVIFIGLLNFPNSLYLATWQSFFADNFTGTYAKRVYSVRSKFGSFAGLFTVLISGIMLTSIPKNEQERLFLYQMFYLACFALTLFQLYLFSKVDEKRTEHVESAFLPDARQVQENLGQPAENSLVNHKSKISFKIKKSDFAGIIKNKELIIFCACGIAFHFSWQMGWPLYFIYNVDYALLNEFQLSLISLVGGLAQFVSYSRWTRLAEKKGSNLALFLGAAGVAINPLFYGVQLSFPVILLLNTMSGAFLAGFNLSLFYSLLETLPNENKTVYISVFNTLTNTTGFVAPLVGVWVYNKSSIFIAMVIVGALRVAASMSYLARWHRGVRKVSA